MKKLVINGFIAVLWILCFTACSSTEKIAVCGCSWDQVAIVDKESSAIEWIHQLQEGDDCNDIEITQNGDILYAYKGGARLVNRAHKVLWDFKVEKGEELNTATELPTGEFLLAVCSHPSRIITLSSLGEIIKEQTFDSGIADVHGQFRQVFPTSDHTYLIPLLGKGEVIELNQSGEVIRRINVGGNPFSVKIMPDNNWIVACGDAHKFVVVDPHTENILYTISDDDVSDVSLLFVAESQINRKGNFMIANWNGHSSDKTQAKIFEIDSRNRVVWKLAPSDKITNISAFHLFRDKR